MNLWLAISLVLAVVTAYLFVIEVFLVAFKLTGLATSKVRFQVASLFTGTGYTTAESELIAKDEKRRKIARACIYTGHVFSVVFMGLIINVVISLSLTIRAESATPNFTEWYFIILYITSAVFIAVLITKIPAINIRTQRFLEKIAINASKRNKNKNIINVIDLQAKYAIVTVILNIVPEDMNEVALAKMGLNNKHSINVLSIRRDTRIVDVTRDTMFRKGDVITMYGPLNDIREVFVASVNGKKEAVELDRTNEITLINNYGQIAMVEIFVDEVPKELENVTLEKAHLSDKYNINIGFIERQNQYLNVDKDSIILKGDRVTVFGPYNNVKMLFENKVTEQK